MFAALSAFIACSDKDDDAVSQLAVDDLSLTTAEDTPISGAIAASGELGTLSVVIDQQPSHGTLVLTATTFTYTPAANYAGADSVTVTVSDAEKSVTASIDITITPVNDPPAVPATSSLSVDEDSSITLTPANLGVTDIDTSAAQLSVTVVSSTSYLLNGDEVIPLPDFFGSLEVDVTISDGTTSVDTTVTLTVNPVNDAPDVTVPAPQGTDEDVPFTFTGDALVSVSDRDAGSSAIAIELSADTGGITLSTTAGLTFTTGDGTDDGTLHFTGTVDAVNAALDGMVVTPTLDFFGLITFTITVDDQGATGSGGALDDSETFILGVADVDLPPFNTIPDTATLAEDGTFTFNGGNVISVLDSDAPGGATVSLALAVSHGVLTLSGTTGLSFTVGDGTADAALTFSGTFADVNTALDGLLYTPAGNYNGPDTLTLTTTSNGLNDADDCDITVTAVNDGPDITGPASAIDIPAATIVTFAGGNLITVTDIDSGSSAIQLTVTATTGTFTTSSAPSYTFDTSTPLTAVLTGTVAQFAADLDLLQWDPGAFSGASATLSFLIDDLGATGTGGPHTDSLNVTINVATPLLANADAYNVQGNVPRVIVAPGVLANDSGTNKTVTTTSTTSVQGGTVTMAADGSFTYVPPLGVGARQEDGGLADSFTYQITGTGGGSATGTVNITLFRVVWFVDKDGATATQDGTFTHPFDTIEEAAAATLTSHFGTYIYVYDAATAYVVDATLPPGTSLYGSLFTFDFQDGTGAGGYGPDSTQLPAIGRTDLVPTTATALHLGDRSRITGFSLKPGAITTGPAIEGIAGNSGAIDNTVIDDFQTAIALTGTSSDRLDISDVTITDANDAVTLTTDQASGLSLISCLIQRVQRGLTINSSAGAGDNGRLGLFVLSTEIDTASQNAITINVATGASAVISSEINIRSSSFLNLVPAALGVSGISITASSGALAMALDTVDVRGFGNGVTLAVGNAQVNALWNDVDMIASGIAGAYAQNSYKVTGSAAGQLDLTATGLTGQNGGAFDFVMAPGALNVCLDLSSSTLPGTPTGLSLTQSSGFFRLEGWNGVATLSSYFTGRGVSGGVTSSGTFSIPPGGNCAAPPVF